MMKSLVMIVIILIITLAFLLSWILEATLIRSSLELVPAFLHVGFFNYFFGDFCKTSFSLSILKVKLPVKIESGKRGC